MTTATPPTEKSHPLFPSNPPIKVEVLLSLPPSPPHFLKIWLEAQHPPPPPEERGGAHYGYTGNQKKDHISLGDQQFYYLQVFPRLY